MLNQWFPFRNLVIFEKKRGIVRRTTEVFDNWLVGRIKYAVLTQRFDTTLLSYPYLIVESVR
jgi:hypothetical protein